MTVNASVTVGPKRDPSAGVCTGEVAKSSARFRGQQVSGKPSDNASGHISAAQWPFGVKSVYPGFDGRAYLKGELPIVEGGSRGTGNHTEVDAREAPADYGANSGRVTRVQIGKAGTRLADQIENLFP
jgi:hypothetical protein